MVRVRGWDWCVLWVLPLACTPLDDENAMPLLPGFAGGTSTLVGAAGNGASTAGGAGETAISDTTSGGASGATSLAGAAGDIAGGTTSLAGMAGGGAGGDTPLAGTAGGGAGGQTLVAGMAGGGAGGMTAGGGGGGAGPDLARACTGDASVVCVAIDDARALFYDAEGVLLLDSFTPRERALPEGGMITVLDELGDLTSYVAVPAGTTIRHDWTFNPTQKKYVQPIQITLSQYRAAPASLTWINTGCTQQKDVPFGEPLTLNMSEDCLVDGKAEILIRASEGAPGSKPGVIHVKDIELGDATLPAKVVELPAWSDKTETISFTLNGLPTELQGSVGFYAYRGGGYVIDLDNFSQALMKVNGSDSFKFSNKLPATGVEWWRWLQVYESPNRLEYAASRELLESPLPSTQTKEFKTLLAIPKVGFDGDQISIDGADDPSIDRVLTKMRHVGIPDWTWRIWSPPGSSTIVLPELPADFAPLSMGVESVIVQLEDSGDFDGYANAFGHFTHGTDVDAVDPRYNRAGSYRLARRTLELNWHD